MDLKQCTTLYVSRTIKNEGEKFDYVYRRGVSEGVALGLAYAFIMLFLYVLIYAASLSLK